MTASKPSKIPPKVSIGLPLFNGEKYLPQALDSLLNQSFEDFELIISDNASTDESSDICQAYAARDSRIRYCRNDTNIGAAANYNHVVKLARGEYFKWAAHDDICTPDFLRSSVEILDQDPSVVLVYPTEIAVDAGGSIIPNYMTKYDSLRHLASTSVPKRFHDIACLRHPCFQVFGLIRLCHLWNSPKIANYIGSDRVLLAELSLRGRFEKLPDAIYFRRHPEQFCALQSDDSRSNWLGSGSKGEVHVPNSKYFLECTRLLRRVPLCWSEKLLCYLAMADWVRRKRHRLMQEIVAASKGRISSLFPRAHNDLW